MKEHRRNIYLALIIIALLLMPPLLLQASAAQQKKRAVKAAVVFNPVIAAAQNAILKNSLNWNWSGKPQLGWELILPLINVTLGLDINTPAGGDEFARALAQWQAANSIAARGVLDQDSLLRMIRQWQAKLPRPPLPGANDLAIADSSFLYDPARPVELRQLERQTYAAYQRMIAAALADTTLKLAKTKDGKLAAKERFLKIVSAYRPQSYQDKLIEKSKGSGPGLAKVSHHLTGRALDLYVGGEPTSTSDANRAVQIHTPAYQWLVKHAYQYGFYPYFYEPWHWEYNPAPASR